MVDSNNSKESPLLELLDQSRYAPVRESLMWALDKQTLLRLSRTSKGVRGLIYGDGTLWNINARLERFFDSPDEFRARQRQNDALISGSFALQFFEHVTWPGSDLDMYVQMGDRMESMHKYLIGPAGYVREVRENWGPPPTLPMRADQYSIDPYLEYESTNPHADVLECRTYYKVCGTRKQKIQLMATRSIPWHAILRGYYMSCIINFITWNKAYCMFPKSTFVDYKTYPLLPIAERWDDLYAGYYEKYAKRGWQRVTEPPSFDNDGEFVPDGQVPGRDINRPIERLVGDRFSWIIRLDTTSVKQEPPSTPDFVIQCSGFVIPRPWQQIRSLAEQVYPAQMMETSDTCKVHSSLITSNGLEYTYASPYHEEASVLDCWDRIRKLSYLHAEHQWAQLSSVTQFELWTAAHGHRPGAHDFSEDSRLKMPYLIFAKPDGWTYVDDQVPLLCGLRID